jgi:hypothetical protein
MKREINDLVDSIEYLDGKTVEFDEIACCALDCAFEKNPETTSQLRQATEEKENLDGFREILRKTGEFKFIPVDNIKTVCGQIASGG